MARKSTAATFEKVRVTGNPELDLSKMSGSEKMVFKRYTFSALERFYAAPENVRKFEEWRAKRHAAVQTIPQT